MRDRNESLRLAKSSVRLLRSSPAIFDHASYTAIPMLIDSSNNVSWAASDWFRYLCLQRGNTTGTVERKALAIREWFEFLHTQGVSWENGKDSLVRLWRQTLMSSYMQEYDRRWKALDSVHDKRLRDLRARKLGSRHIAEARYKTTVNFKLNTLTQFYLWSQRHGYLTTRIIGVADLARGIPKPPLTVGHTVRIDPGSGEILSETASSPWCFLTALQPRLEMPSGDEVETVKVAMLQIAESALGRNDPNLISALTERNALILELGHIAHLRRKETVTLSIRDVPTSSDVEKCLENNVSFLLDVLGKGSKFRKVAIPPYLAEQLRAHVDEGRADLVAYLKNRGIKSHGISDALFLSTKTGRALVPASISGFMSKLRRYTGLDVTYQKLRHRGITEYVLQRREHQLRSNRPLDDGVLLIEAKDRLGHAEGTDTARIYLHVAKLEEETRSKDGQIIDPEKEQLRRTIKHLKEKVRLSNKAG